MRLPSLLVLFVALSTATTATALKTRLEPHFQGWWLNKYEAVASFTNAFAAVYEGERGSATLLIGNILPNGNCVSKKHTSGYTASLNLLNLTAAGTVSSSGARKLKSCGAGYYDKSTFNFAGLNCDNSPPNPSNSLPTSGLVFKRHDDDVDYPWNTYKGCKRRRSYDVSGPSKAPISRWPGDASLLKQFPKFSTSGSPPFLRGNFGPFQATKSFATGYYTRNGFAWMTRVGNEMTGVSGYFASYKCNGPYGYTAVALKVEVSKNGREYTSVASCETGKYDPKTKKLYIRVGEGTTCPSSSDGGFENALIQPLGSGDNIKPCS